MSTLPKGPPNPESPYWLRKGDQVALGSIVFVALLSLAWYWSSHGGWLRHGEGRLIEIDHEPKRSAKFEIDINTAPWAELAQLPGIGHELANRIVQSRQQDGPFASVEDLRRVRGMGPKTLARIRQFLRPVPKRGVIAGKKVLPPLQRGD